MNPEEAAELLLRDLRSSRRGLSSAEARRHLVQHGPNELQRRHGRRWPRELARQLTHPLALLLWLAAALLFAVGSHVVAAAVGLIILLNAAFAFVQEVQAERAVEALARYLPPRAKAVRDGVQVEIDAAELGGDALRRGFKARPASQWDLRAEPCATTGPCPRRLSKR
ncbi:cation-transporting P-type ATPase [Streptomyces sp. NPDC001020]